MLNTRSIQGACKNKRTDSASFLYLKSQSTFWDPLRIKRAAASHRAARLLAQLVAVQDTKDL